MNFARRWGVVFVFVLVLSTLPVHDAYGQTTLVLQPDGAAGKDTNVEQNFPDSNFGSNSYLTENWGVASHAMIEFDISALPAGVTITSATLEIFEELNCSFNMDAIEVHLNSAAWDEATVTWNNAPAYGSSIGTNSGETSSCEFLIFDVTGAVQDWASGASTNYGFRLTGPSGANCIKYMWSSDHATSANRPILRIEYQFAGVNIPTTSEWGMILLSVLIALSAVTILWRRNRATA